MTGNIFTRWHCLWEESGLQHVFTLPCNYSVGWCLSKIDNDTKSRAMFGSQDEKMKDWGTKVDGYTSEEKGVAAQIAAYTEENA